MILTGEEIIKQFRENNIVIFPFSKKKITTNSYDLMLGENYLKYTDNILDPSKKPHYKIKKIPKKGLLLKKGDFILGHSFEKIGSKKFVPIIHAKSGIARLGLFVHITADLIDIGSFGNTTFQMYATLPVRIFSKMLIAQVSFWKPLGKIKLYTGKYQGSKGPRPSEAYKDFEAQKINKNISNCSGK